MRLPGTKATASDGATIPDLLAGTQRVLPEKRMETFAYDKAADDEKIHALTTWFPRLPCAIPWRMWATKRTGSA